MHDTGAAAVGRREGAQARAGDLLDLARVMHVFVHHDQGSAPARVGMARQRHRVVQVGRALGAQRRGGTHRAHQHDGLVVRNHQAQEVRRFFKRVRAVRNDDARHRGVLAQRVHAFGQRAPNLVRHVLAADIRDLFGADLGDAGQLRHRSQQIVDRE
ncbi:hypothetical protein D3C71_1522230 [compost metagenome]